MTLIDQMLHSPRLPQYVRQLTDALAAERAARERFWNDLQPSEKAEFINGEVIVHSPAKFEHIQATGLLQRLLGTFAEHHALGFVGAEKALVSLTRNDYEPDVAFWTRDKAAAFLPDQMKFPAPDLVVEVLSPSTQKTDRTTKFEDYAIHGIDEYWIVDPSERTIEQYLLEGDRYTLSVKVKEGLIHSRAIRGLQFPVAAAFDPPANLFALQDLLSN